MNVAPMPVSSDWEVLIRGVADSTSGREELVAAFAKSMGGDLAAEADESFDLHEVLLRTLRRG